MKTVVISGANRGIGLGFCIHYLTSGWRVIAVSSIKPDIKKNKLITKEHTKNLLHIKTDLTNEESINDVSEKIGTKVPSIDLILNNAGIAEHERFGQWSQQVFLKTFSVNAVAPALLVQALSSLLAKKAKIIQLSSGLASFHENIAPLENFDSYSMGKVALNMLTKRLSAKLESREISVCSISPGWVKTDMGGENAPVSVNDAVKGITATIEKLTIKQSGDFLDEHGNVIPW